MKIKTRDICLCAVFAALTAVGAFIKIPIPYVPFTLQTLFTSMAGLLLGSRRGGLSILIYIVIGLLGIPVFTQGGGIGYVLMPTFGYLIGFMFGTFLTGLISERYVKRALENGEKLSFFRLFISALAGLAVIYLFGVVYFYVIRNYVSGGQPIGVYDLLLYCFLVFIPGDVASCVVSAIIAKRLLPVLARRSEND